jgi:hypothetical protein
MSKQGDREQLAVSNTDTGPSNTMDVTGSLRKIARELSELRYDSDDLETKLEGASWLIAYIADALDVELQHAAARGMRRGLHD